MCTTCSPVREYVRLFDVTERTSLHRHGTGRNCSHCSNELRDTIVHFGERGTLEQPLNWRGAAEAAKVADVIICLGSSLKVSLINQTDCFPQIFNKIVRTISSGWWLIWLLHFFRVMNSVFALCRCWKNMPVYGPWTGQHQKGQNSTSSTSRCCWFWSLRWLKRKLFLNTLWILY